MILTLLLSTALLSNPVDVAGGNHQTYTLKNGIVLSMGEDLMRPTDKTKTDWIGGKLGRPIDSKVLPGKDPSQRAEQARYNPSAEPVTGLDGLTIINIASGQNDAAAITDTGKLYMWGPNNHGQLGLGDTLQRRTATLVPFPPEVIITDVAIGGGHTLALTSTGQVYSWGFGKTGVLGHGSTESLTSPRLIEALSHKTIVAIATGQNTHSLFLDSEGTIYVCGRNSRHLLGLPLSTKALVSTPIPLQAPAKFKTIAIGIHTGFAITHDGQLYGWGNGSKAHFPRTQPDGSPDLSDLTRPTLLENAPPNLVQVVAGSRHTAVLDDQGRVFTWGIHTVLSGQLGIGPPQPDPHGHHPSGTIYSSPQQVSLPENRRAAFLDSLTNNVFLTTTDGLIYGWGQTAHGRLGCPVDAVHQVSHNGKTLNLAHSPVPIPFSADQD